MSPSEFDLRAALRAGEGDTVDPDAVLSAARTVRHERRVRIGSALGAVLVVGGIGVGVGVADLSSAGGPTATGSSRTSSVAVTPETAGRGSPSAESAAVRVARAVTCPPSPKRYLLPGGDGTTQFGGTGPLFAQPVAAMRVCLYWSGAETQRRGVVLSGSAAQSLATSLNDARTSLQGVACPDVMPQNQVSLELFGVTASGQRLPLVTAQQGCRNRSTNGTDVRFDWTPPANLARLFAIAPTH